MKFLKLVILLALYSYLISAQSWESESFENFLKMEQEGWLQKIEAERSIIPDTSIEVKFYHISLEVSLTPYIKGNVNCIFTSNISSLTEIKLDLTSSLTVDSISGSGISFNHTADKLIVQLDRPYTSGEETSVIIYYSGAPPVIYNTKGMRYEKHHGNQSVIATLSTPFLAHLWFPCKDGPEDKADSVYIDITIPDTSFNNIKLSATSNGVLESVISHNGKRTFYWRERYPIVPYYVMIAVSNYVTFVQDYSDTSGVSFPIIYNVFKEDSTISAQGVQQLPEAMALFSRLFGQYPFSSEKYGMTQIGFYGAIENQTNTIQNSLDIGSFDVSVHELAHMWFGDMITCSSWHHGWLNEGFATYCSALWAEYSGGQQAYRNYMKNREYFYGGTTYLQITDDPFYIFIPIIYSKGAWVLHMLRGVLGDEAFFSSLLQYASDERFRYKHATTEDFRQVCETISGTDIQYFFDQWIYDQYYPEYEYSVEQDPQNVLSINLNQVQSSYGWREIFTMPVQFRLNYQSGGDTTVTLFNNQKNQTFQIPLSQKVSSAEMDPDNWILKKILPPAGTAQDESIILSYSLFNNYPNPFNSSTTVKFSLAAKDFVQLKVYDILGRESAVLVNQELPAGIHEMKWDAAGFTSGIYFLSLKAGEYTEMKKIVLLK